MTTAGPVARSIAGTYLFGLESTYESAVSATKDIGLVQTFSQDADHDFSERIGQGQAKSIYVKAGQVTPKGNIEIEIQHGRPLEWAIFGGTTTHSTTSNDVVHTFVYANALPSLTCEYGYKASSGATDFTNVATGLVFGNSTVSLDVKGVLKMRSDFVAQNLNFSGTTVPAAVVDTDVPLGGFEGSVSIGSATAGYVQNWEWGVNRNAKVMAQQGSRMPAYGASHQMNITWKATIGLDVANAAAFLSHVTGSSNSITSSAPADYAVILGASNGVTLGSGLRAFSLTLNQNQCKYTLNANMGDFVTYDLNGSGTLGACTYTDAIASASW